MVYKLSQCSYLYSDLHHISLTHAVTAVSSHAIIISHSVGMIWVTAMPNEKISTFCHNVCLWIATPIHSVVWNHTFNTWVWLFNNLICVCMCSINHHPFEFDIVSYMLTLVQLLKCVGNILPEWTNHYSVFNKHLVAVEIGHCQHLQWNRNVILRWYNIFCRVLQMS